jgi:hypothetical protein
MRARRCADSLPPSHLGGVGILLVARRRLAIGRFNLSFSFLIAIIPLNALRTLTVALKRIGKVTDVEMPASGMKSGVSDVSAGDRC